MKIPFFAAVQKFNALLAIFSTLGLDLESFLKIDATALKARLDAVGLNLATLLAAEPAALKTSLASLAGATAEPSAEQLASLFTAELTAAGLKPAEGQSAADCIKSALAAKDADITKHTARLGIYDAAFAAARITPKPGKEGEALAVADVTLALNNRISIGAQEALAKHGLATFPAATVPTGPDGSATQEPNTLTYEQFSALTATGKMDFSAKGGRITGVPMTR